MNDQEGTAHVKWLTDQQWDFISELYFRDFIISRMGIYLLCSTSSGLFEL